MSRSYRRKVEREVNRKLNWHEEMYSLEENTSSPSNTSTSPIFVNETDSISDNFNNYINVPDANRQYSSLSSSSSTSSVPLNSNDNIYQMKEDLLHIAVNSTIIYLGSRKLLESLNAHDELQKY